MLSQNKSCVRTSSRGMQASLDAAAASMPAGVLFRESQGHPECAAAQAPARGLFRRRPAGRARGRLQAFHRECRAPRRRGTGAGVPCGGAVVQRPSLAAGQVCCADAPAIAVAALFCLHMLEQREAHQFCPAGSSCMGCKVGPLRGTGIYSFM